MSNSIRRLSKSVQDSLRRLGSIDSTKRPNQTNSSWVYKTDQWVLKYDDGEEVNLTYVKHERVPMKDFAYEVRATLDVGHFLNHAVLLLDLGESSMEGVVDVMITKLFQNTKENFCTAAEVKACLFANDSVHLLSRTIQGTSMSERASSFDYDQTWICAM
ncbi:unnamed protein product [Allacma fusca]|nr:unnamed protein product [Allacma fusca]